jgi:hypothetical protein
VRYETWKEKRLISGYCDVSSESHTMCVPGNSFGWSKRKSSMKQEDRGSGEKTGDFGQIADVTSDYGTAAITEGKGKRELRCCPNWTMSALGDLYKCGRGNSSMRRDCYPERKKRILQADC